MTTPDIKRRNYGRGHGYTINGEKVPGVTTVIGNGLPKPALMGWAAKTIAEYVADRLDQADGHVLADQLVADLGELAHTKGKPWPDKLSRTKVAELLKGIHYEDRDQAAKRGTEVHALAERLARGEEIEVPEPLTGHVDAYLQFLDDWQPTDALLEVTVGSTKHHYSGTLDMIATLPGLGRCLLDIKTSRSGPFGEVALQLAGYRYAEFAVIDGETVPMPEVDWCGVIWVRADGYDLYPFEAGPAQFRTYLYVRQVGDFLADQDPRNDSGRAVKGAAITPDQALQGGLMNTDLVPVDTFALVPAASDLASQIAATDFAPQGLRGKPAAVMAAMLQGHELGIGPMQALSQIAVINGKPCMSAQLMRALVQRAGHDLWFESKSNTKVVIAGRRSDWPEDRVARVTWTMDDAKAAGLSGGQNYRKYPRAMLAARATGEWCRDNCADVLGGIGYTPEELSDGDLVADGDLVIEGRDDVAPDAPHTNRRQAGRAATAKKAPAKKAAAPRASAPPPALPEPPLPGEPGFDEDPTTPAATDEDIVDAEVVDDDQPATLVESLALVGLTAAKGLRRARELAGEHGHPLPMAIEEVGDDVLELLVADLGLTRPAGGGEDHRDRRLGKMWALVADAWPDEDDEGRDKRRKGLIAFVGDGATSSKALDEGGWRDLFDSLELIVNGSHELHLTSNGDWDLRPKRATPPKPPAKKAAAPHRATA